ncbi:MAG TPA: adenylate/guanylate cyclase domain-containing protein [Candidatus Limnocylindria bacterium]|nr:adenylate/guanylate cyclase domain-containing protein [Candidatus Limnocylindria bacterium]
MSAPMRPAPSRPRPQATSDGRAQTQALTFVFTDIEGSTRLLEQLRDRYAEVLAIHGRLIGEAAARAGGELVDTQGDSFFLVFATADQAVAFASAAQRALERQRWPGNSSLRVRMGIHAGEATPNAGGYVGLDVHRAARISSAAHGGQVLLSPEAARALANGAALKDIGSHGLKDFSAPIVLHQLAIVGLPADFPPPRVYDEPDQPPAEGEPPYQGLAHFEEEDAPRFFGREKLVARLVARLAEQPFLAVIGASGSGKSSVVRAGLIPALRAQGVSRVVLLTPTAEPFAALAAALLPDAGAQERDELAQQLRFGPEVLAQRLSANSLLVVDQAEELFSLTREEDERAAFIERLLSATESGGKVVLTLRADFYDRLAGYPQLRELVAARQEYLGQMSPAELRAAITGPAEAGGWRFDAGLVELILHDVGTEPGALPLLSHALLETWQRRRGRLLMLRGYLESGGVQGAIARSADRLMAELEPGQQDIARAIFLRLTEFGAGTPDTRRRAALDELVGRADASGAAEVLQRLADRRLVVLGTDTAEVAHEALIREWPTLREWLAADREALRLHRGLTEAAGEWQRANREPSLLYRGARLAAALDWAPEHSAELNALEREFIEESQAASEREAQRQRTINRRLRFLLAGAGVFLVVAIGAGAYAALEAGRAEQEAGRALSAQQEADLARLDAEAQAQEADSARDDAEHQAAEARRQEQLAIDEGTRAEQEARLAQARALSAAAVNVLQQDPQLAILLALEAIDVGGELEPDGVTALHKAVQNSRALADIGLPVFDPNAEPERDIALSPGGDRLYVTRDPTSVDVYDVLSGRVVDTLGTPTGNDQTTLRTDGSRENLPLGLWEGRQLAYVDRDGVIHIWDLETRTEKQIQAPGVGPLKRPAFSSDGRLIAVVTYASAERDPFDLILSVWDIETAENIAQWSPKEITDLVEMYFHPDNTRLLVPLCGCNYAGDTYWLDIATGTMTKAGISGAFSAVVLSPDGALIAAAASDRTAKLFDAETGELLRSFRGHRDVLHGIAFSLDGRQLATTSADGTARIWDVESEGDRSGIEIALLAGQSGETGNVVFSADRTRVATLHVGSVRVWDPSRPRAAEVAGYELGLTRIMTIERGGDHALVHGRSCTEGFCHGDAVIIDFQTGQQVRIADQAGIGAGLSPDGATMFGQRGEPGEDRSRHRGQIWATDTGTLTDRFRLEGHCEFSHGQEAEPWLQCGPPPATPYDDQAGRFSFSSDGSIVAMTGNGSGTVGLWDASDGRLLALVMEQWLHADAWIESFGVALSPDGQRLAVATYSHGVFILDVETVVANYPRLVEIQLQLDELAAVMESLDPEPMSEDEHAQAEGEIDGQMDALRGQITELMSPVVSYETLGVRRLAFLPDGRSLAIPWAEGSKIIDVTSGDTLLELPAAWDLDVSADGTRVVVLATDGTVSLWDVATRRVVHSLDAINYGLGVVEGWIRFTSDERHVILSDAGMAMVMTVDTDELVRLARERLIRSFTDAECQQYLGLDRCAAGTGGSGHSPANNSAPAAARPED